MKQKPRIHKTNLVAKSRLFQVEEVHLEFTNGETRVYERLKGRRPRGAVMIVPVQDNMLYLVREYAAGTDRYELGFPKGLIEEDETNLEAANRELMEEVGFGANTLNELKTVSAAPGYMGGQMMIVLAQDLYPKKLPGDEPEEIEVVTWSLDNLSSLLRQPDFTEARSFAALYLMQEYFNRG